ncbi:acetolactate synthase small subunit [Serratia marcescens]|uniref:Acetolactate synthase small subunit n=1 Tax=Serratia marcescens TaxID=615 RepID=A0A939SR35_SERMA|nr:acetolactate synthase small subunit [Serratia marcescens]
MSCWKTNPALCRAWSGLFSQRGYNIESLTVAPTDDPTLSRMTIQTVGDEKVLEQIEKQLLSWWTCCASASWCRGTSSADHAGEAAGQRLRP